MQYCPPSNKNNNSTIDARSFGVIICVCILFPVQVAASETNVLLLHSYHQGLSWTDSITAAVQKTLSGKATLYVDYLDAKRQPVEDFDRVSVETLEARHRWHRFAAVIVSDNDALAFVKRHRETLFADTPIVFCGINKFTDALIDDSGFFTGTVEQTDPRGTFEMMRHLNPSLRRVVVIADGTPTGLAEMAHVQSTIEPANEDIEIVYLFDLELRSVLDTLATLNAQTDAVLLTILNRDAKGRFFTYEQAGRLISDASAAPVYGLWDFYLGHGIAGGRMASAADQGRVAAAMAVRIVEGQKVQDIPILRHSPNRSYLDYAVLERFGLSQNGIFADATVINRSTHWMVDHWEALLLLAGIMAAEAIGLFWLFYARQKDNHKAIETLAEIAGRLEATLDSIGEAVITTDMEGNIELINPVAERLTGWTLEMAIGHPVEKVFRVIHKTTHQPVSNPVRRVLDTELDVRSDNDAVLVSHDGPKRRIADRCAPICTATGSVIGAVLVFRELTDTGPIRLTPKDHPEPVTS